MIILGVSYLSDAGSCIVKDGKIISAINEERLNRIKLFHGIPELAIQQVLKQSNLNIDDVDFIVTQGYCKNEDGIEFINNGLIEEESGRRRAIDDVKNKIKESSTTSQEVKNIKLEEIEERYRHENYVIYERNLNSIRELKKFNKPIKVIEHHMSHAAAAYFLSGWNECFILTADGWGEMESSILCCAKDGKIKKINYSHSFDSLGYFYGSITKSLGFRPHRHEGKVLGLAGYGNYNEELEWIQDMISYNSATKRFEGRFDNGVYRPHFDNSLLKEKISGYSREDVAFAVQRALERVVLEYISDNIPNDSNIALSGGIFANVLLNQKILELSNISNVFVFPHMGDGGLAVGSAMYYYSRIKKLEPVFIDSLYLGSDFDNDSILNEITSKGLEYTYHNDIENEIANLLAFGKVVFRFCGKMEYGPRALGNRTILYQTTDKSVNCWLNKSLHRSEFMPFAPATLKEHASKCYKNIESHYSSGFHMTMTFDCTDWMKEKSPGVVHIDGTARPQLVDADTNLSFYKVLKHYYRLTGIPSLINTSYNMHEEPIVCSPCDALRAFIESKQEYLAIGDYMVRQNIT